MSSGTVPSRDPDAPLTVVRGRQVRSRGGREIEAQRNSRPIVVVLGMHRSGTSLLSNLLHYLGVDMADTTDHVSKRNAGGFWERPALNVLQDEVLEAIGRPIASPEHCLPFPPAWWRRKDVQAIKPRLIAFLEEELARSGNLWGFKDPRTCRLLPLWWEIFRELDLAPIYVHAVRSPAESSISMSLKNPARAISATQGELMWLAYNYDILRYVALDHPTLTVHYDEWFADGALVARRLAEALGIGEDFTDDDLRECVESVVSPELRNHVAGAGSAVSRMPIAGLLYDAMLAEQRTGGAGSRPMKNQMSFIALLMKSTAPIIAELAPLTEAREEDAGRARALDEEIVLLNRKLLNARSEAEALREKAELAGRLDRIDAQMRDLRNDTPRQLDELNARIGVLGEDGALPTRIAGIEAGLATLAPGGLVATDLETIRSALGERPGDRTLNARLAAIEEGLDIVANDDGLKVRLLEIETRLRAIADDTAVPARLADIELRLGLVADGEALGARFDTIEARLGDVAQGGALVERLATIEALLGRGAQGETLAARFDTIEARLGDIVESEMFTIRIAAIEARLERTAEGETLAARLDTIEARLGEVAEGEVFGARLAGIEERVARTAEGDALGARFDAIEARLGEVAEAGRLAGLDERLGELARRDETGTRLDGLGAQLATLVDAATATIDFAALDAEAAHLRGEVTRLGMWHATSSRRARAVIAAARRDRLAATEHHRRARTAVAQSERDGERLAVERLRTQRLAKALAARDETIAALQARIAAAPTDGTPSQTTLARPGDMAGVSADDYGVSGGIDRVDHHGVSGWVCFADRPDLVPVVELAIDGAFVLAQVCSPSDGRHVFSIDWRDVATEHAGRTAVVRVAGIETIIEGPELVVPGGQRRLHQLPAHAAAELFGGSVADAETYQAWLAMHGADVELDRARDWLATSDEPWPLITVVVFGDDAAGGAAASIAALKAQIYPYWEALCADNAEALEALDPRVRAIPARASIHAIASGELLSFVESGDVIARTALLHLAIAARAKPDFALIYSDEDKIDPLSGVHGAPHMKGAWSDDLAIAQDYASRLALIRRDALPRDAETIDRARIQQIVALAGSGAPAGVIHLPFVLYHRVIGKGRAPAPGLAETMTALAGRLPSRLADATVENMGSGGARLRWPLPDPAPRVSLIVPTRDRIDLLRVCVDGLLHGTAYPDIEVVIADNDSVEDETRTYLDVLSRDPRVRIVSCPGPFNYAAINNIAVAQASGTVIALVNNDLAINRDDWLTLMVENALRPDVGIAGAKLLYGDDTVQHAGVVLGIGTASHPYRRLAADAPGRWDRLRLTQDVSAVTAACLVMRRSIWDEVGGLDGDFPVAYNDVDLCLKVTASGYRIVWVADAIVYHLESQTRGLDENEKRARLTADQKRLAAKWGRRIESDPFYNLNLATTHLDGRLGFPPRAAPPWAADR